MALRPYLMHDGSIASLRAVVERYNRGLKPEFRVRDGRLGPLHLADAEIEAIVAFLKTLTPDHLVSPQIPIANTGGDLHDQHAD